MNLEGLLGFLVVIFTAAGTILFTLKKFRSAHPPVFRRISAITRLKGAIGLSVEDGSRVHVSLGSANLNEAANPSALVGLDSLHRIGQLSSTSDQPPVCTSGDGAFSLLSKDVLGIVAGETNTRDSFNPDHGQLTGVSPFSYALGAMEVMADPGVKTNVLIGNFGPESGFLTTTSEDNGAFTLAASDSIVAQSVFMASTRDMLIGEELFAVPAYLVYRPAHLASLRVQDILRLGIAIALVVGALLKVFGIL